MHTFLAFYQRYTFIYRWKISAFEHIYKCLPVSAKTIELMERWLVEWHSNKMRLGVFQANAHIQ